MSTYEDVTQILIKVRNSNTFGIVCCNCNSLPSIFTLAQMILVLSSPCNLYLVAYQCRVFQVERLDQQV